MTGHVWMYRTLARSVAVMAAVTLGAMGCSDDSDEDTGASPTTSGTASPTDTSATTGPETSAPVPDEGEGCSEGDATPPDDVAVASVADVDGDGRDDTAWVSVGDEGATTVGVRAAAGGGATRLWDSASPVTREILVVDADEAPPVEILASDGRTVELWAFSDCEVEPVRNVQGETYTFSLGFTGTGTGVGCADVGGSRELVGLDVIREGSNTVEWSRTVVNLDGPEARNGETTTGTFTRPEDDEAIDLLHGVSCGELTMSEHGIPVSG